MRVLNLVPGTRYPVLYRKNPDEILPRQKFQPRQKPTPPIFWALKAPEPTSLVPSALVAKTFSDKMRAHSVAVIE
jgi:hypothetical protein